ncbi:C-type lectin domain family 4 member F-like isoform X2 [Ctenopharyngodon idella]|uniref:C-type lectin domain family 4 member F-like isoform X2 n=1 Tax=Ctenopharyngodon idella TaxID=7959 RepID=UPI00222E5567|nr:C-type lectin domain family 4 member F-like isoform X2 [Ctenopharyngodon idella]
MYRKTQEQIMELDAIYESDEDIDTTGPRKWSKNQDKEKAQNHRSRRLVLMTVCLGLICALLLVSIILQHISNTAERESLFKSNKNTAEEFNQTINSLQDNYTDLMTEKDQLKNNFNFLSQKKLELETRVSNLTAEKSQLQGTVDSLSQKKLELESKVTSLSDELKLKVFNEGYLCSLDGLFISSKKMSWSESRQYCSDRGADLVIINTEEKQRLISSFKERVWIGLTDIENEGNMKWVDNSPLKQGMKRQTFQMKDNPLLTSKTVLLKSIRHYFDSTFNLTEQMKVLPAEVTECCIVTTDEDKNGHSYVKLDEDIVKRSCDKAAFKYYSF